MLPDRVCLNYIDDLPSEVDARLRRARRPKNAPRAVIVSPDPILEDFDAIEETRKLADAIAAHMPAGTTVRETADFFVIESPQVTS